MRLLQFIGEVMQTRESQSDFMRQYGSNRAIGAAPETNESTLPRQGRLLSSSSLGPTIAKRPFVGQMNGCRLLAPWQSKLNSDNEAQSCRSIGWPYMVACRVHGPLLKRNAMVDRPDAGIVTNGHKLSHTILDVFPLSFQNIKNSPIKAIILSQPTVPMGYT
jgi:hypothetical protein